MIQACSKVEVEGIRRPSVIDGDFVVHLIDWREEITTTNGDMVAQDRDALNLPFRRNVIRLPFTSLG